MVGCVAKKLLCFGFGFPVVAHLNSMESGGWEHMGTADLTKDNGFKAWLTVMSVSSR